LKERGGGEFFAEGIRRYAGQEKFKPTRKISKNRRLRIIHGFAMNNPG
jgi:hypothetical protein